VYAAAAGVKQAQNSQEIGAKLFKTFSKSHPKWTRTERNENEDFRRAENVTVCKTRTRAQGARYTQSQENDMNTILDRNFRTHFMRVAFWSF
jgi:hypothetical protein